MDSFQMNIINSIFDSSRSTVSTLDLSKCCRPVHWKRWSRVTPLELHRQTKVGLRLSAEFEDNVKLYSRSHLINLQPHSMPLFLYKDILHSLKQELQFKPRIKNLATAFLSSLNEKDKEMVFVGLHARRGDRILNWKHGKFSRAAIGRYEGRFFNTAMEKMREDYNSDTRKVVFLATSDKVKWLRDHLVSKDDIYYPHQMIRQSKVALPSIKEISMMHAHRALSVKGAMSYGVDLAVLAQCNHTILDYGTFGLFAALFAGGRIILPRDYSVVPTPESVWWEVADMPAVEYISLHTLNITNH